MLTGLNEALTEIKNTVEHLAATIKSIGTLIITTLLMWSIFQRVIVEGVSFTEAICTKQIKADISMFMQTFYPGSEDTVKAILGNCGEVVAPIKEPMVPPPPPLLGVVRTEEYEKKNTETKNDP